MPKLFVSWVVNRSGNPDEFGNAVLEYGEPESQLDIQQIELKVQNKLMQEKGVVVPPTLLWFKEISD